MIPTKFTQEIKDNWLANLKSGKYKQGFGALINTDGNEKYHCCIGVLGQCTEGLGNEFVVRSKYSYDFLQQTIGKHLMGKIIDANDNYEKRPVNRDYSNVIPLIELLPVQE